MTYVSPRRLARFWTDAKNWIAGSSSNLVHRSGDETIEGVKTFENSTPGHNPGETWTDLVIRDSEVERGVLGEGRGYTRVILADSEGDLNETQAGRLALLEVMSPKQNDTIGANLRLGCYKYSSDPGDADVSVVLHIGYDTDGIPFANAPSTSSDRSEGMDIITRDWIPKDTRIVHTTGDETISGKKTVNTLSISNSGNLAGTEDSKILYVCSGTGNSGDNGAFLTLCGSTSTFGSAGYFLLRAGTTAANTKTLQGQPDGTLTWDGQTIQTSSDERKKTPLSEVPDDVLDAWGDVGWGQFRYLDAVEAKGASARLHLGLIAQRVKAAFEAHGLDACEYGILCHEEREATEVAPAVDLWMVRYAEAQSMEAAYQRRRADRLEARIAALEAKLA